MINVDLKPKILYVDDESINLRLFKISYRDYYIITTSPSAEEVIELINEGQKFDIIVSDQRMPGMTGTEFMIKAKEKLPNAKYILLTGYTDIEALEKAINEVGLWQYVKKPWEPSNLKFILDNAYSSLKTEKENVIISSALKKSEERLNLALSGTNAGVWDWNLKTNEMYLSPTWKKMLGYDISELNNNLKTLESLIHPEDLQKSFKHLDDYIRGLVPEYEIEYRLQHKNGTYIHVLSRGKGIKDETGDFERLTGTNIDLTEKYKAQEEIKKLNEELEERVERRTHALKLLNIQLIQRNKFEHLISKISSELIAIQSNELDNQINTSLNDVIEFSGADNCFLFKIRGGEIVIENENTSSKQAANIQKIFQKKKPGDLPLIFDKLNNLDPLILRDTNVIPEEFNDQKKLLIDAKIKSILIIPLAYNKEIKGGFGLSYSTVIKDWNLEDINLLRFIGEIFINSFERFESEKKLLERDKEISQANEIISENEKKAKILQNIASIANSPLPIEEVLNLIHEIIISQGKGISGILTKLEITDGGPRFTIERSIAKTVLEKNNLKQLFIRPENELKRILNSTFNSKEALVERNIKLNYNPNTLTAYSFVITSIPVIVGNNMLYIYLTLLPPNNTIFNDKNMLDEISREISFVAERDITKKELKKALQREKELGELKSQFVSMASHQFRTPLTVIHSNVELFQMLAGKIDSELKGKFDKISTRIQDEVLRLGELMNDVLLLGKLNANVLTAETKLGNIVEDIKEVVDKLNSIQDDQRCASIRIIGDSKEVNYDSKLFNHAFTNLVENAFKYSINREAPLIEIEFFDDLLIRIIDFGRGIPKEDLNKLFQPFFRSEHTQDIEGTGLGLAICKRYIELQNGELIVESELNQKTVFTIKLPL